MTNYAFINPPRRLPWHRRIDVGALAEHFVLAFLLTATVAVILKLLGADPHDALMLPALAVNYKFVDQKAGLTSGNYQGLNAGRGLWLPATQYNVGDIVQNGGFAYKCSVAGISAAAPGPSPNTLVDNAATWVMVGPVSSLCQQDATAQHELGYQAIAEDATYGIATFMYVTFTGVVNAGDFVIFDNQGKTCVQTPAAAPGASKYSKIGISMGNQINGSFGWVLIQGVHDQANVTAALTQGTILTGSATAGRCNQGVVNYIFDGAVLRQPGVAGTGTVELYWPSCSGR